MKEFFESIKPTNLILISCCLVILAMALLVLVLSIKGSKKKKVIIVEKKYLALRENLTSQDASMLSRLEKVSHLNLQYADIYEEYLKQFKLMLDGDCKYIEKDIELLKECLKKKNNDSFKKILEDCKKAVSIFKDKVVNFDNALHEIIQPEENSRVNLVRIKESYRSLKSKYSVNENDLRIVEESVKTVFGKIDETFAKFEELVERAEYDEANSLLPTLQKVIDSLDQKIEELPSLCIEIDQILPANIKELGSRIRDQEEKGVPTYVLGYNKKLVKWNDELKIQKQLLKDFKFSGIKAVLAKIQSEIDITYKELEKELSDKVFFDNNLSSICSNVDEFEKKYLKITEIIPALKEVYVIGLKQLNEIELLKESANDLSNARRGFDGFIQTGIKQPFSTLKAKLDELDFKYQIANGKLEAFKEYIDSIKVDSQNAYNMLYEYYNHLREIEVKLKSMNSVKYFNERVDVIESCFSLLNDLNASLHAKPLNISSLNEDLKDLRAAADPLFQSVEEDYKLMQLAESAILFNNRDREHQSDVHEKLKIIENQFINCEFGRAYQEASELYKNKHIGE